MSSRIRKPAVSGQFYPGDKHQLDRFISQAFEKTNSAHEYSTTNAVIVPHAGYKYSGDIAASAFSRIQPESFDRVILLGPSHHFQFQGGSIAPFDCYRTPLGEIDIDNEFCDQLINATGVLTRRSEIHQYEHSLEVEIPFIQRISKKCKLIPIVIGEMTQDEVYHLANELNKFWKIATLIVISSDFTHYGKNFGYCPFKEEVAPDKLELLDHGAIDQILAQDSIGFLDYVDRTGATICGKIPIAILLAILEKNDNPSNLNLVQYTNSGKILNNFRNSVSYASIVSEPDSLLQSQASTIKFSDEEKDLLLKVAHHSIVARLNNKKPTLPLAIPNALQKPIRVFITLRLNGRLRGCIGSIQSKDSLINNIIKYSIGAAFEDPRFSPLTFEESNQISIEISCLTPLKSVQSISEIVIGKHGIVLENGNCKAVFLPQVPIEQNWDKETTLESLSEKAGLSPMGWSQRGTKFSVFEVIKFSD